MNENSPDSAGKGFARRRLLRGTFAAPAVMTLYSGGALAVASNRRCIANQVNTPVYPVAATSADTFVRVRLWTLTEVSTITTVDSTWVAGSDVVALLSTQPAGTTSYLPTGSWQLFTRDTSSSYLTVGATVTTQPSRTGFTFSQNGSWVAVRVNANGDIIGVVGIDNAGSAVYQSCWTSFKAA